MSQCNVCGSNEYHEEFVSEVFEINGQPVLVEHIPARVCLRCGDVTFSRETMEQVRKMLHGATKPVRTVQMNVFAFG